VQLPAGRYSVTLDGNQAVFTAASSGNTYNVPARIEKSTQRYDRTAVEGKIQGNIEVIDAIDLGGTADRLEFDVPSSRPTATAATPATLVRLTVVAADAKGQPVLDLSAADLRILDNGKPQTIASFRRREALQASFAPLGPRQFSNRSSGDIPHATVVLFDLMNMRFEDRGYVITQLVHALQQFESGDNLYLYLLTVNGRLYPVHGLPASAGDTAAKDAAWPRDVQAKLMEAMQDTSAQRPMDLNNYYPMALWRTTFEALSMVAARLAAVPGRKNIVWLTHGLPISLSADRTRTGESVDFSPYVHQLSNTLDHADVSIYAVQQSPPGSINSPGSPISGMGSEETLDDFANLTGGHAYGNNDIVGAIRQAVQDVKQQSYLISYAPPRDNWDGTYHYISITCTRPGVRLQARQGYFAFADAAASAKQAQEAIDTAILSPFDAAEIGLRATVTPLPGDKPVLRLAVRIDLADVQLTETGDVYTCQLAARVVEYQDDGTNLQTKPSSLDLRLTREQRDAAMKEGYAWVADVEVSSHVQKIRAIVFDSGSTAIGSLSVPVNK